MEHLIRGVRDAVDKRSWYAAVALVLTLPDSCAALDDPTSGVGQRYRRWADRYVTRYFANPSGQPFLTGRELYRFRCAFLHAGELDLNDPEPTDPDDGRAMFEVLNRINLLVSDLGVMPARGMTSTSGDSTPERATSYSVGVPEFCDGICRGAEDWLVEARADAYRRARLDAVPRIIMIGLDGSHTAV